MDFILKHKPMGVLPPEVMKACFDMAKQLSANPAQMVPGAKFKESYWQIGTQTIYCLWEAPNIDTIAPLLRQMSVMNWETEVIPVEKGEVALASTEKMMQAIQAQMKAAR